MLSTETVKQNLRGKFDVAKLQKPNDSSNYNKMGLSE
jgi:hypothetical protein